MMYLIHLGYLGYDQDAQTAFIPNEEIRQELTAATRRNTKNISVSLRNYNKNIADKTVLSSRKDENTMKYDFTTILDRREKTRLQWNLLRLTGSNGRGRRRKVLILSQCGWQI